MHAKEAEEKVKELLIQRGFDVTRLETEARQAMGLKTADFRAEHPQETWVIEVKERILDRGAERRLDAGESVSQTARIDDDPERFYMALRGYRDGVEQIRDTRCEGDLSAVWFVLNEHVTKALDAEQLLYALLGRLEVSVSFPNARVVYAIHDPEFGTEVDAVVFQVHGRIRVVLNPWTDPGRLARARASRLVQSAAEVVDPRDEIDSGTAWVAPPPELARELCRQHLATLNTDKKVDSFEGRKRREFHVQCALNHLYGPDVGSFSLQFLQIERRRILGRG